MKTKPTHPFLALPIIAAALIAGSPVNAATVFSANFNGTTVTAIPTAGHGFGAQLTAGNLNAGTATGSWIVNQAQAAPAGGTVRMIQGAGGNVNVTNKALRFGIDFVSGTTGSTTAANTPILTANLTSTLSLSNTINVSQIPEPSAALLGGLGFSSSCAAAADSHQHLFYRPPARPMALSAAITPKANS